MLLKKRKNLKVVEKQKKEELIQRDWNSLHTMINTGRAIMKIFQQ